MDDLLSEMKRCKTTEECIEVATIDAYGVEEQATSWLTCFETLFEKIGQVKALDQEVELERFDLANERAVVAVCRKGYQIAWIALESVEFKKLSAKEKLWLKAYKKWSHA
jgi:hypothetical protein